MEEFIALISVYWPTLVDYATTFVAYFLVFLFRNKVTGTERNLNLAFKEFKTKFSENESLSAERLAMSESRYNDAVNKIEKLETRLQTLTDTLLILLGDEEFDEFEESEDITEKPEVENDAQYEVDDQ